MTGKSKIATQQSSKMDFPEKGWTIGEWLDAYRRKLIQPREAMRKIHARLSKQDSTWIYILSTEELDRQLDYLESHPDPDTLPLYGVPYVVKDNIDVEGLPTTAACPAYRYVASKDATVVSRLRSAGAILLAKTNLDQFATGLVGTRSPYGVVHNSFNPDYVSGGSSSGSAVTVARGLVSFSLGTDTAGSGRVPAGFNNLVGLKPTKGRFSCLGVVPACRSLDCVSVFALNVDDADLVAAVLEGWDPDDFYSRAAVVTETRLSFGGSCRFGIPAEPVWFGDAQEEAAWNQSLELVKSMHGVEVVPIDFKPMQTLALLLYGGPWVAERKVAISKFMESHAEDMNPVVRGIIEKADNFSAADTYAAEYRRAELTRVIQTVMSSVDALLVPTTPTFPTIAKVTAQPVEVNSQLGTYTNFVNLADCSALSLPAGFRDDGLPFGITLIAPAWHDAALADFGRRWQSTKSWSLGATGRQMVQLLPPERNTAKGYIRVAVVGAHLRGMPLNAQITDLWGVFVKSTFTSNSYRLYALPNTVPQKPALIRHKDGVPIAVELWDLPKHSFGEFVDKIPQPLGIGTIDLSDGSQVKGFICEGVAVERATDISSWGGWRSYVKHCDRFGKRKSGVFSKVLIANRGEIAVRIARTLKEMGIESVAVYSDADHSSTHVHAADAAINLRGCSAADTYLNGDAIIAAALKTGSQAIIPGYGFLSENATFAEKVEAAGLAFVGPTPQQIAQFGLKHTSRELAAQQDLPLSPGTGLLTDINEAVTAATRIGYPVMVKSTAGGGGIGLTRCNDEATLIETFSATKRLSEKYFSDGGVFLERFIADARHVEVQIFGDGKGNVIALGERDCSLQRRNQKVIEETPACNLPVTTRERMFSASVRLGKAVNYRSAGTIEYLYDQKEDAFYFMEVNSRLQVEHTVTEAVTGFDLVEWMIRVAEGDNQNFDVAVTPRGASMEARLYAEDPTKDFQPSPGVLTDVFFPATARVDTWITTGTEVSPYYDSMLAKIIVHGHDRADALKKFRAVLDETRVSGISTNLEFLRQVVATDFFASGNIFTNSLTTFRYKPPVVEVIQPGTYTSVHDYPGRIGYWKVGVPPSGPMDDYAFRMANRIVGNHSSAAALEITLVGPKLLFHDNTVVALTGAQSPATLNGDFLKPWSPVVVEAGQILDIGKVVSGCRSYLAVRNGFDVPLYLGSRSTFALGQFGGHAGRPLRAMDMLSINCPDLHSCLTPAPTAEYSTPPADLIPAYPKRDWSIGVLYGPHGAPEFFTKEAIEMLFNTEWEVHYNSNRLGIRLNGPKPTWSRSDGGEAGLHPSNIHDVEYAMGSVNFTGDMPIILTQDGPSLGGFVCPVTIVKAELWKLGQVRPGDRIRFRCITFDTALALELAADEAILRLETYAPVVESIIEHPELSSCILASLEAERSRPEVVYRQAGDKYILVEYGPNILDLRFRLRVHALVEALTKAHIHGIVELSPGVRSLQINYDSRAIHQRDLMTALLRIEDTLPSVETMTVPSRIVHLPMVFEDPAVLEAISRYRQSVRDTAPWLPRNIEFIRRINGLDSIEQVRDVIFSASYMVLGLGDVYLGAPCAVPVDPRHRLVTSKYNPARTFTAEGTVGIGGVYMCIYGMDSPGGYQLVGRTLPIWNKFVKNRAFVDGDPWLLRFFDRVQFYPVSAEELVRQREQFRDGQLGIRIEEDEFKLADYEKFLVENTASIEEFKMKQQVAFEREVKLWKAEGEKSLEQDIESTVSKDMAISDGFAVCADISGSVWKVLVHVDEEVHAGQPLVIIEAMKMEFTVFADRDARVNSIVCAAGTVVNSGDPLVILKV